MVEMNPKVCMIFSLMNAYNIVMALLVHSICDYCKTWCLFGLKLRGIEFNC